MAARQSDKGFIDTGGNIAAWTAVSPLQLALEDREADEPQGVFTRLFVRGIGERLVGAVISPLGVRTVLAMLAQGFNAVHKIRRGGKKSIPHEGRLGYNCACLLYATDGPENCLIAGPISGTNVGA